MMQWLAVFACLPLSWGLTYLIEQGSLRGQLLDLPGERSSHQLPTPTAGGLGMLISFLGFLVWFVATSDQVDIINIMLVGVGVIAGFIGYLDDRHNLKVSWRFLAHLLLALGVVVILDPLPELLLFGWKWELGLGLSLLYMMALTWFVNLYNFMDGIDGLAASEAITVILGAMLIIGISGDQSWLMPLAALALSVAGFLIFNWPPARLFMGDVGSIFLGFTLGILAIITSAEGIISIWSWCILLALFVCDATVTLLIRLVSGERIYQAHNSHAYQILARRWSSHRRVTLLAILINIAWLWPLAWCASEYPYIASEIAFFAYFPLLLIACYVRAKQ